MKKMLKETVHRYGSLAYQFAATRLNLDVDLRYRAVARLASGYLERGASILEVGAGTNSIGRYLGLPVTAVDLDFPDGRVPRVRRIQGSACSLPFMDKAWDIVCSVDMLEHIPRQDRNLAIGEMVRIARKVVLLAVPVGDKAYMQDIELHHYYERKHSASHQWVKEHVDLGLPKREDISSALKIVAESYMREIDIFSYPNVNLKFRSFFMKLSFSSFLPFRCLYAALYPLALVPKLFDRGECYREIFIADLRDD